MSMKSYTRNNSFLRGTPIKIKLKSYTTYPSKFKNVSKIIMRKKDIHPEYYDESKVYCKGEHVLTVSGTLKEYYVDIWSGNHPLFQGKLDQEVVEDSRLDKFARKYGGFEDWMKVPVLEEGEPEGLEEYTKKKAKSSRSGKK